MKLCGMTLLYRDIRNSGAKMPIDESVRRLAGVGFEYADLDETMKKYNFAELKDGYNVVNGEKIFYISNPALGLWALKKNFK
jgi:hypothetical protein